MKHRLKTAAASSGLLALGMLSNSCADNTSTTGGTHLMGPPGKEQNVPNSAHPSMAR